MKGEVVGGKKEKVVTPLLTLSVACGANAAAKARPGQGFLQYSVPLAFSPRLSFCLLFVLYFALCMQKDKAGVLAALGGGTANKYASYFPCVFSYRLHERELRAELFSLHFLWLCPSLPTPSCYSPRKKERGKGRASTARITEC